MEALELAGSGGGQETALAMTIKSLQEKVTEHSKATVPVRARQTAMVSNCRYATQTHQFTLINALVNSVTDIEERSVSGFRACALTR